MNSKKTVFFQNPISYLSSVTDNKHKKSLFGICAREKSLEHTLILLHHFETNSTNLDVDIIAIVLNVMASYSFIDIKSQKLVDLLIDNQQNFIEQKNHEFWSTPVDIYVKKLISMAPDDERIYTLAIRFYCQP